MDDTICVSGRRFSPELLQHLQQLAQQEPPASRNQIAQEACRCLGWFLPDGQPAVSSAKIALGKLQKRSLLSLPGQPVGVAKPRAHRLRASGQSLPPVENLPPRVDQVRNLHLYLVA